MNKFQQELFKGSKIVKGQKCFKKRLKRLFIKKKGKLDKKRGGLNTA